MCFDVHHSLHHGSHIQLTIITIIIIVATTQTTLVTIIMFYDMLCVMIITIIIIVITIIITMMTPPWSLGRSSRDSLIKAHCIIRCTTIGHNAQCTYTL